MGDSNEAADGHKAGNPVVETECNCKAKHEPRPSCVPTLLVERCALDCTPSHASHVSAKNFRPSNDECLETCNRHLENSTQHCLVSVFVSRQRFQPASHFGQPPRAIQADSPLSGLSPWCPSPLLCLQANGIKTVTGLPIFF
jgi:hypothetical protein